MKKQLITSALPRVDALPHLGNLAECLLPADVYARFLRQRGKTVLFVCGTDDYGLSAQTDSAKDQPPTDICQNRARQIEFYQGFNLSFDYFGRTGSEQNKELMYRVFRKLDDAGLIAEKTVKQLVIQWPESVRETLKRIETNKQTWPDVVFAGAEKCLDDGMRECVITRDLNGGFPVPKEGFEKKEFCGWFGILTGSAGITKQWADEKPGQRHFEEWWLDCDNVILTEFSGKDTIADYAITFPAILRGTQEPWTQAHRLKGMNYLTYNGEKFAQAAHFGFCSDAVLKEFPADYWRYWLIANAPETDDSAFSFTHFAVTVNKDLNDVFGNFINRVLKVTVDNFGQVVPPKGQVTDMEKALYATLDALIERYTKSLSDLNFRQAMTSLREIWVSGNNYLAKTEPWKTVKTNMDYAGTILNTAMNLIRLYAELSAPIMPQTAKEIFSLFYLADEPSWPTAKAEECLNKVQAGTSFHLRDPLFRKISPERLAQLTDEYRETSVGAV